MLIWSLVVLLLSITSLHSIPVAKDTHQLIGQKHGFVSGREMELSRRDGMCSRLADFFDWRLKAIWVVALGMYSVEPGGAIAVDGHAHFTIPNGTNEEGRLPAVNGYSGGSVDFKKDVKEGLQQILGCNCCRRISEPSKLMWNNKIDIEGCGVLFKIQESEWI